MQITITHVDTACVLLDISGFRILTDPAFDEPGGLYYFGWGTFSKKYSTPSKRTPELGRVDLVLLSHDQHQDNLDTKGRAFLSNASKILSTQPAARRIPGVVGLADWETASIDTPLVPGLTITAVPAQHAAFRFLSPLAGKVIGFVLQWDGQERGVYYISGDTVLFPGIQRIAERFPEIDTAILHLGSVGFPYLSGPIRYTFNSDEAVEAVGILRPKRVIPVHYVGWWHFRERVDHVKARFAAGGIADRMLWLRPGDEVPLQELR